MLLLLLHMLAGFGGHLAWVVEATKTLWISRKLAFASVLTLVMKCAIQFQIDLEIQEGVRSWAGVLLGCWGRLFWGQLDGEVQLSGKGSRGFSFLLIGR